MFDVAEEHSGMLPIKDGLVPADFTATALARRLHRISSRSLVRDGTGALTQTPAFPAQVPFPSLQICGSSHGSRVCARALFIDTVIRAFHQLMRDRNESDDLANFGFKADEFWVVIDRIAGTSLPRQAWIERGVIQLTSPQSRGAQVQADKWEAVRRLLDAVRPPPSQSPTEDTIAVTASAMLRLVLILIVSPDMWTAPARAVFSWTWLQAVLPAYTVGTQRLAWSEVVGLMQARAHLANGIDSTNSAEPGVRILRDSDCPYIWTPECKRATVTPMDQAVRDGPIQRALSSVSAVFPEWEAALRANGGLEPDFRIAVDIGLRAIFDEALADVARSSGPNLRVDSTMESTLTHRRSAKAQSPSIAWHGVSAPPGSRVEPVVSLDREVSAESEHDRRSFKRIELEAAHRFSPAGRGSSSSPLRTKQPSRAEARETGKFPEHRSNDDRPHGSVWRKLPGTTLSDIARRTVTANGGERWIIRNELFEDNASGYTPRQSRSPGPDSDRSMSDAEPDEEVAEPPAFDRGKVGRIQAHTEQRGLQGHVTTTNRVNMRDVGDLREAYIASRDRRWQSGQSPSNWQKPLDKRHPDVSLALFLMRTNKVHPPHPSQATVNALWRIECGGHADGASKRRAERWTAALEPVLGSENPAEAIPRLRWNEEGLIHVAMLAMGVRGDIYTRVYLGVNDQPWAALTAYLSMVRVGHDRFGSGKLPVSSAAVAMYVVVHNIIHPDINGLWQTGSRPYFSVLIRQAEIVMSALAADEKLREHLATWFKGVPKGVKRERAIQVYVPISNNLGVPPWKADTARSLASRQEPAYAAITRSFVHPRDTSEPKMAHVVHRINPKITRWTPVAGKDGSLDLTGLPGDWIAAVCSAKRDSMADQLILSQSSTHFYGSVDNGGTRPLLPREKVPRNLRDNVQREMTDTVRAVTALLQRQPDITCCEWLLYDEAIKPLVRDNVAMVIMDLEEAFFMKEVLTDTHIGEPGPKGATQLRASLKRSLDLAFEMRTTASVINEIQDWAQTHDLPAIPVVAEPARSPANRR